MKTTKDPEEMETPKPKVLKTIRLRWTGIRPLLMSNPQTVDPLNKYSRKSQSLNNEKKQAKKKTDNWDAIKRLESEMSENDFLASVYWNPDVGFYLTTDILEACIRAGAAKERKGKDVQTAVMVEADGGVVPIKTKRKHKSIDDAFLDPEYLFRSPVKIPPKTGSLVMKSRCMMPTGWQIDVEITYDDEIISKQALIQACVDAGALCGLGGWRPKFGRFTVEVIE